MILYHGTSSRYLDQILAEGIKPRGRKGGNWKHSTRSNPKAVYLTNAYALHFGKQAARQQDKIAIFEIDTSPLNWLRFAPDEDFLEQATRVDPEFAHLEALSMHERTEWFKKRAHKEYGPNWEKSLNALGTCAYYGTVPKNSLLRVATFSCNSPICWHSDPTITLMNYAIMGSFYRNLIKRIFGDQDFERDVLPGSQSMIDISREGIEVKNLREAV